MKPHGFERMCMYVDILYIFQQGAKKFQVPGPGSTDMQIFAYSLTPQVDGRAGLVAFIFSTSAFICKNIERNVPFHN